MPGTGGSAEPAYPARYNLLPSRPGSATAARRIHHDHCGVPTLPTGRTPVTDPLIAAIIFQGLIFPLAIGLAFLLGVQPWAAMEATLEAVLLAVAATLPPLLGLWGLSRARVAWFEALDAMVRPMIDSLFRGRGRGPVLLISLLAGFGEELLFRGVLQGWLSELAGPWTGVLVAAVVFGLLHFLSWTYFLFAVGFGLYLGVIYELTGNLLVVCLIHALYDWAAIHYLLRNGTAASESPPP